MLKAIRKCIRFNAEIVFQKMFHLLLEFYLNPTFLSFEDETYLQKQGICMGSCVAPVLCNIFLSDVHALHDVLDAHFVLKVLNTWMTSLFF